MKHTHTRMRALLYRDGGRNLSLSRLALRSNFDASVETYKCSCSNMQVHSVRQITTAVCFATFYAWLQTSAPRPLIGRQTMRAEWHMFLPLMTLLSRLGDRAGGEEAPPSDM